MPIIKVRLIDPVSCVETAVPSVYWFEDYIRFVDVVWCI